MNGALGSNAEAVVNVLLNGVRWLPERSVLSPVATTVIGVLKGQVPFRNTIRLSRDRLALKPTTGFAPARTANVGTAELGFIDSENVKVMGAFGPTLEEPSTGVIDTTVGPVVSGGAPAVVKME